jgi:hypothetical protein
LPNDNHRKRFAHHTFQNVSGSVMFAPHGARSF